MTNADMDTSMDIIKHVKEITDAMDQIRVARTKREQEGTLYTQSSIYVIEFKELETRCNDLVKCRNQLFNIIFNRDQNPGVDIVALVKYVNSLNVCISKWDNVIWRDREYCNAIIENKNQ